MLFYLKGLSKNLPYVVRHRNEDGVNIITFHATDAAAEIERKWRRMNGALRVRKIHLGKKELTPCADRESTDLLPIRFRLPDIKRSKSTRTSTGGKSGTRRSVIVNSGMVTSASPMNA